MKAQERQEERLGTSISRARRRAFTLSWLAGVALLGWGQLDAQPSNTEVQKVIDVRAGDTFSEIAATITGDVRTWRRLYDSERSGLPNPNLILAGSRLELVREPNGRQYLRVAADQRTAKSKATSVAAAPTQLPRTAPQSGAPTPLAKPAPQTASPQTTSPSPLPAAGEPDTLVIGVLPNISAAMLMAQYEHMKHYLERLNSQNIKIVTSANFKAFFDSMMNGEFDLAVSAPHFARVAQLDRGLIPLVIYEPRINAVFVTPADKPLASAQDVRGGAVAFANPQSLVAMYGQRWLGQQNLQAGKDYDVKGPRTDLGVGRLLLSGEASAAIMSGGEFRSLPADESSRLVVAETFARIPNFIVLGNPRLDRRLLTKLKGQLKGFISEGADGSAFASATGISGISDVDETQLRELDAYAEQTRRAMGVAK